MKVDEAKKILEQKEKSQKEEIEAQKVIEQDRLRQIKEKEEAERESLKKAREDLKARFPKTPGKAYMKCRKCKKELDMEQADLIQKNVKLFRVIECEKCGSFNVEYIITIDAKITSKFDALLSQLEKS